jgi:hypothetical protein
VNPAITHRSNRPSTRCFLNNTKATAQTTAKDIYISDDEINVGYKVNDIILLIFKIIAK